MLLIGDTKRHLVLFSGGMDSTYLVWSLLRSGKTVHLLYVDGGQHDDKIRAERKACKRIIEWLRAQIRDEKLGGRLCVTDLDARYVYNSGVGVNTARSFAFAQAFPWFSTALQYATSETHDVVSMAYVMGDQITVELHRLIHAWDALWDGLKQSKRVELTFPLIYTSKQTILQELPRELMELTWVCELPYPVEREGRKPKLKACDHCEACKRHARELFTFYGGTLGDIEALKKTRDTARDELNKSSREEAVDDNPQDHGVYISNGKPVDGEMHGNNLLGWRPADCNYSGADGAGDDLPSSWTWVSKLPGNSLPMTANTDPYSYSNNLWPPSTYTTFGKFTPVTPRKASNWIFDPGNPKLTHVSFGIGREEISANVENDVMTVRVKIQD